MVVARPRNTAPMEFDSDSDSDYSLPDYPPPKKASLDEVATLARQRSANIDASYADLNNLLSRHEATLQKRWLKKTRAQRVRILTDAWPGMASVHGPDLWAWRNETPQQRIDGTKYRDHFLWPYVNQVDLARPRSLLLLLNSRGRHHPSHFAAADIDMINLGLASHAITPVELSTHTMILTGAEDVDRYGTLCDNDIDGHGWGNMDYQFKPGEGLLVLEMQERLLDFLVRCCKIMLHDMPAAAIMTDAYPVQPMPELPAESDAPGSYQSLAVMTEETPYRPPAVIDFARITSLLEAKVSDTRAHLWQLREDPAYFADQMLEVKEHMPEMVKDSRGGTHPYLKPGQEEKIWSRVIGHMLREAHNELEMVTRTYNLSKRLPELHAEYAAQISPTKDLPEEFLNALLTFRYYLIQAARWEQKMLLHTVIASSPLRKFFERYPSLPGLPNMIQFHFKPGVQKTETEQHLLWAFRTLSNDDGDMFFVDMDLIVNELDYLMQTQPEVRQLVSRRLARTIGYLSVIGQCLNQLKWYQPWSRRFYEQTVDRYDILELRFSRWSTPLNILSTEALPHRKLATIWRLGDVTGKRFYYPVDKRRTKENVEAMRLAERNLDELWAAIDKMIFARCLRIKGLHSLRRLYGQWHGALQRTPPWVDLPPDTTAPDTVTATTETKLSVEYDYAWQDDQPKVNTITVTPPKVKVKTRGVPQPPTPDDPETDESPGDSEPEPEVPHVGPIAVDARTLKTFRTIFFIRGASSQPGEVSWKDFLYALTSTRLFAAEKLPGSAWTFYRLDADGNRGKPIQIHEPHPIGKIPFYTARNHGRRLKREFGIDGDSFVLKG